MAKSTWPPYLQYSTVQYSTVLTVSESWSLNGIFPRVVLVLVFTRLKVIILWGRKHVDDLIPRSAEVRITCNH